MREVGSIMSSTGRRRRKPPSSSSSSKEKKSSSKSKRGTRKSSSKSSSGRRRREQSRDDFYGDLYNDIDNAGFDFNMGLDEDDDLKHYNDILKRAKASESREKRTKKKSSSSSRKKRSSKEGKKRKKKEREVEREREIREEPKETKVPERDDEEDEEDDYADDGFEDYEDDFEDLDDDAESNAGPKEEFMQEKEPEETKSEAASEIKSEQLEKPKSSSFRDRLKKEEPVRMSKQLSPNIKPHRPRATHERRGKGSFTSSSSSMPSLSLESSRAAGSIQTSRRKKRKEEVKRRVRLQVERIDVFEIPSLDPWDFYIRSVGLKGLMKQAFCQTNDDAREMGVQAEPIDTDEKSCNFPVRYCSKDADFDMDAGVDATRKLPGLDIATQICEVILEENLAEFRLDETLSAQSTPRSFSESALRLGNPEWISQRSVLGVAYSPTYSHILLTAHGPIEVAKGKRAPPERDQIMMCVWDLFSPKTPSMAAFGEGTVSCCLMTPMRLAYAVAGTEEGSLKVWDLNRGLQMDSIRNTKVIPYPSYSTDHIIGGESGHETRICDIQCIVGASNSFQIASLDESMVVQLWSLVRLKGGDDNVAGAAPASAIQLIHVARIEKQVSPARHFYLMQLRASKLCFDPRDARRVYIGFSSGDIRALNRFGSIDPPNLYRRDRTSSCGVTAIAFNPHIPNYFLAGYGDGEIALFERSTSAARHIFYGGENQGSANAQPAVRNVCWSSSRPSVFFVTDSSNMLCVWDIARDVSKPIITESLCDGRGALFTSLSQNGVKTRRATLAVGGVNGIDVHTLCRRLGDAPEPNAVEDTIKILSMLI